MIYLLLEIYNYKQLKIISRILIEKIETNIINSCTSKELILLKKKNGVFLFCLGDEKNVDLNNIIDLCIHFHTILKKSGKELYGFNLILSSLAGGNIEIIENTMSSILLNIQEQEEIWIPKKDKELFTKVAILEDKGEYLKVFETKKPQASIDAIIHTKQRRKHTIKKIVKALTVLKRSRKKGKPFIIVGLNGIMKREIILTALNQIFKASFSSLIPIIRLQQKYSLSLFPLLASINDYVLKNIEKYLNPLELKIWKKVKNLFFILYKKKSTFADHINRDFYIGYNLYFSAYLKIMEKKKLPAIIICENTGKFPPPTRQALAKLIRDFSFRYKLFPIFISENLKLPEEFNNLRPQKIEIKPLNTIEIKNCFVSLYPGVQVPQAVLQHLKRLAKGKTYPILHYIYYLKRIEKIKQDKKNFIWIKKTKKKTRIPVNPLSTAWFLINTLNQEAQLLLYTLAINYSLLSQDELIPFFHSLGEKNRNIRIHIKDLQNLGFLSQQGNLNYKYIKLLSSIKKIEPHKCRFIEKRLLEHVKLKITNLLPFAAIQSIKFFSRLKDYATILEILPNVINHSLDRFNFKQAELLLNIKKLISFNELSPAQSKILNCIITAKKLRYSLLRSQLNEAQQVFVQAKSIEDSYPEDPYYADLYLQMSRYYLANKKIKQAIAHVKKATIYFQELNQTPKINESYIVLGQALLAKGNIYEAFEYFGFAEKLATDCNHLTSLIKCLLLKAITLFLLGNYSRALIDVEEALKLANAQGLRNLQLLLAFFKARLLFDLGLYIETSHVLQECLCIYQSYNIKGAHLVIHAWLARTYAYMGEHELAINILKNQKETQETLFFRAEALFISNNNNKAIKTLTKALHFKPDRNYFFIEQIPWRNGFCIIEECCFEIATYGTELYRLIKALRGYLLCNETKLEQGIKELHTLTIIEKLSPYDPYAHHFYLFYYLILKKKIKIDFAESADRLTVLNLALKHLQERSTAIDDPKQRINYISKNYWNKQLMHEAKENKLL